MLLSSLTSFRLDSDRNECEVNHEQLEVLLFADELVMLVETEEALQHILQKLNDKWDVWGMKPNWQKTRVMKIGRKHEVCHVK